MKLNRILRAAAARRDAKRFDAKTGAIALSRREAEAIAAALAVPRYEPLVIDEELFPALDRLEVADLIGRLRAIQGDA